MLDVLLAEDVRRQDADAAGRGIPVATLMENAGFAVARAARSMLGGTYGKRIVILCGKGNNAGDGLVAGHMLAAWGAAPVAVLTAPRDSLSDLAAANLARFPGPVVGIDALGRELSRADLVIDALFGVGLSRAPAGEAAEAIGACNAAGIPVLAVDVPSGVVADTGAIPGEAVRARATITFAGLKPGLLFPPGAGFAGEIRVADIGIPTDLRGESAAALERNDVAAVLPRRGASDHKRRVGTVLVVAGSRAMPGAAALATAAAVHGGAGLTTLCAPEDVCRVVLSRVPEITTIPIPESAEGTLDLKALELVRPRLEEFHAIAIGPGLSTHPAAVEAVRALVAEAAVPVVLDADGLNAVAGATELLRARTAPTILTPHAGELARLVDRRSFDLEGDRLASARAAARALGSIVVFKGPGTVVAAPDGTAFVNTTGSGALAQGGTGDVLTGLLAALVAQAAAGGRVIDARLVAAGVWLHGAAGDRIAARISPHPANASALIAEIGPALHEVFG